MEPVLSNLEFIIFFIVTVDPGVLVGLIILLVVTEFPQHLQTPLLLVLEVISWFSWFLEILCEVLSTLTPRLISYVHFLFFMVKFMIIVLLTNFKELEFFFVLSFTFSFTEIICEIGDRFLILSHIKNPDNMEEMSPEKYPTWLCDALYILLLLACDGGQRTAKVAHSLRS